MPPEVRPGNYWLGRDERWPLEIYLASSAGRPLRDQVRQVWKSLRRDRPAPVLLVITHHTTYGLRATACGATGDDPSIWDSLDVGQVDRLCRAALLEPTRNMAARLIQESLPEAQARLPGVRNSGLLSTHDLAIGVPARKDWAERLAAAKRLLNQRGADLVRGLGFSVERLGTASHVLKVKNTKRAVAVFLDEGESPEVSAPRFNGQSPVTFALSTADNEGLPYVVITRGTQVRLYMTRPDAGVGRKGRTETFVELNLALVTDQTAPYLTLLFGPDALADHGTFEQILGDSHRYAASVGDRLRERVYSEAVPHLATAIARRQSSGTTDRPSEVQLRSYYEQAMLVLFRILFVAYAEDRDLLPYRTNGEYQHNSLKQMAERLSLRAKEAGDSSVSYDPAATNLWVDVRKLWSAVANGNQDWNVPPYDGGLFDDDGATRPAAALLSRTILANDEFGPALSAMIVDSTPEGSGPVDFRSLSVREFGTIYEGLLESGLGYTEQDLTVDKQGSYMPAGPSAAVVVRKGEFYLHNRSGARKSSGSYFTKPFAVEHLLDHALEPALKDHLARIEKLLDEGDEASAGEHFFDFRCADIAMGSGHFLVAAVDRMERQFANFLARRRVPGVTRELEQLRQAAIGRLDELSQTYEIEDSNLLRRQIARRCIYGVDLNPIAVELARLSIWIHTFVPGLPLSFLDRTLTCGDSLTGIGTLEELRDIFQVAQAEGRRAGVDMIWQQVEAQLKAASEPLKRLARVAESTVTQVKEAQADYAIALAQAAPVASLMDLGVAVRNGKVPRPAHLDLRDIANEPGLDRVHQLAEELEPVHFPVRFPEVFVSARPGFDCIIGNPPWDKVKFEVQRFWVRYLPGLLSLNQAEQARLVSSYQSQRPDLIAELEGERRRLDALRAALISGFPDLGVGDTDLYKVFSWRFWCLIADGGAIGVVLPRSALSAKGMSAWRATVLQEGAFADTTMLVNNRQWVFDEVHPQYTVSLTGLAKGPLRSGTVSTRGPFNSLASFKTGAAPTVFPVSQFREWSEDLSFPLIPTPEAGRVFLKMRQQPRFDSPRHPWQVRPVAELHATADKHLMVLDPKGRKNLWPVYGGGSFNLWEPDTGEYYAWIAPKVATDHLFEKRRNQARNRTSCFHGMPERWLNAVDTLSVFRPRVVVRGVGRATDSRTIIAALAPPRVTFQHGAPYLFLTKGDESDEAFLLGVLCSLPLDWIARRSVEANITFSELNSLPIPLTHRGQSIRSRLTQIAARLAAVDSRYAGWANGVGASVGSVKSDSERKDLIHELDALVAKLYGLDEADLRVIFETFHVGWDYRERLDAVLDHFRRL